MGAAVDEGGNLWVAGGGSGLFVRLDGETRFRQMSTPYPAISVAAGAAGVGYVGYQGLSNCDMAWDEGGDRSVYKSGDADRVTVTASGGFRREHYDISSGRGVVAAEPQGREKVCDIVRLRYDAKTQSIWFGGNHGVAWGDANSTRVMEHTHPSINGYLKTSEGYHYTLISGFYYGLATDARGDLWLGGTERSAKLEFVEHGGDFYGADDALQDHKIDVWADDVPQDPYPSQMVPDETMGFAPLESGLVWAGSMKQGVAVMDAKGKVLKTYVAPLLHREVSAVVADPLDGSVWFGHADGGLTRLQGRQVDPLHRRRARQIRVRPGLRPQRRHLGPEAPDRGRLPERRRRPLLGRLSRAQPRGSLAAAGEPLRAFARTGRASPPRACPGR